MTRRDRTAAPARKHPPADAEQRIRALAADGFTIRGIAAALGTTQDTLRDRWFIEHPELREAMELGREDERHALHNKLYRTAIEGSGKEAMVAAMFLLKARHGYREGEQSEQANRVAITFNLPGARPLAEFIEVENADRTEAKRLPTATVVPSRGG